MPTYATPSRKVVELDVFTGGDASAATFGLTEVRLDERITGDAKPPWSEVDREDYYSFGGQPVAPGTVFERQFLETDDEAAPIVGAWKIVGDVLSMEGKYEAVALRRNRTNDPGSAMRNPLGLRLRDADGKTISRPAIGEQDRDPWTGELMVDENNAPVLVMP